VTGFAGATTDHLAKVNDEFKVAIKSLRQDVLEDAEQKLILFKKDLEQDKEVLLEELKKKFRAIEENNMLHAKVMHLKMANADMKKANTELAQKGDALRKGFNCLERLVGGNRPRVYKQKFDDQAEVISKVSPSHQLYCAFFRLM